MPDSKLQNTWPIGMTETNGTQGQYVVYFALIKTGTVIFAILDWGRGEEDIDHRAIGTMAGRGVAKLVRAGRSAHSVGQECYPNRESICVRWPEFTRCMRKKNLL